MKKDEISGEVRQELPGLSRRVRQRREELGWTQERLADEARVSREHICRVERGHNRTPHTVEKLAFALQVHPLWLTTGLDCYAIHTRDSAANYLSGAALAAAGNLEDDAPAVEPMIERRHLVAVLHVALGFVLGATAAFAWGAL